MSKNPKNYIEFIRYNDVVEITMIYVCPEDRGKGIGRTLYQEFEKNLPNDVKMVKLFAADTGNGNSDDFWDKMGFEYTYTGECKEDVESGVGYEGLHSMRKGVNGYTTPQSIFIDYTEKN